MSRAEKVILTNMCMIYEGDNILVQNKVNDNWNGICFPGGHVEPHESFVKSVIREVKEETGLDIYNPELCGIKQFYTEENERYVVLLFKTNKFSGEIISSDEGEMFWINKKDINNYPLAVSFKEMYEVFTTSASEQYSYFNDGKLIWDIY